VPGDGERSSTKTLKGRRQVTCRAWLGYSSNHPSISGWQHELNPHGDHTIDFPFFFKKKRDAEPIVVVSYERSCSLAPARVTQAAAHPPVEGTSSPSRPCRRRRGPAGGCAGLREGGGGAVSTGSPPPGRWSGASPAGFGRGGGASLARSGRS
jgi:hypothetical protein